MKRIGILGAPRMKSIRDYEDALAGCGAQPHLLRAAEELACVQALVIAGGADLNPALYGEENTASVALDDALDRLELETLRLAAAQAMPVLGICRGHQLINVFFGGTLIQDLPQRDRHTSGDFSVDRVHTTRVLPGSFLASAYGAETLSVNSSHHQAADRIGEGLRAVQFAEDGCVEALAHETLPVWSVQWHPERMCMSHARPDTADGAVIFRWFLDAVSGGAANGTSAGLSL